MSYISFEDVTKEYQMGGEKVMAANHVSFEMEQGELAVVLGPSGAGKTTVLNLLGGMDKVTSGKIVVGGKEITGLSGRELTEYRRLDVGFVFQFYNLMPNLTALENVELARQVCPNALDPVEMMRRVGLGERMNNFPAQLSGGEQQRVSIARALCKNPALLLCDEPTGALDSKTGAQVLALLRDVSQTYHTTVAIITHNAQIAPLAQRLIRMRNGQIESMELNDHPAAVEDISWERKTFLAASWAGICGKAGCSLWRSFCCARWVPGASAAWTRCGAPLICRPTPILRKAAWPIFGSI